VPQLNVFDPHLETAAAWLTELGEALELPNHPQRALRALRAGLHAIRDRLPAKEVVDLGAQLPTLIRGVYYEGWTLGNDPGRIRDPAAMIARVAAELAQDPNLDPDRVLRAVIHLLVGHVSSGEIADVIATLPRSIAVWWQTLPRDLDRTGYRR
jgi:uncharacterized protein (DUF2267 family)